MTAVLTKRGNLDADRRTQGGLPAKMEAGGDVSTSPGPSEAARRPAGLGEAWTGSPHRLAGTSPAAAGPRTPGFEACGRAHFC